MLNSSKYSWKTWLYGLLQSKMEYYLKNAMISNLCDYVNDTATEWNSAISSYPCKYMHNYIRTYMSILWQCY